MKQVNLSANQTEEAYERISKRKTDASADVARMLFSMQNNEVEKSNTIRLTIPYTPSAGKNNFIPQHLDIPSPENNFYKPKEIWVMFNNIKDDLGKKSCKHVKTPLIKSN